MGEHGKPTERLDEIDRRNAKPGAKLQQLAAMVQAQMGEDPRGGGWSFVGNERVIRSLLSDLPPIMRVLAPKTHVGDGQGLDDADVICRWEGVPIRLRILAKGDVLHALRNVMLPRSSQPDRATAYQVRRDAWSGAAS